MIRVQNINGIPYDRAVHVCIGLLSSRPKRSEGSRHCSVGGLVEGVGDLVKWMDGCKEDDVER
jgi:hypothetical protein